MSFTSDTFSADLRQRLVGSGLKVSDAFSEVALGCDWSRIADAAALPCSVLVSERASLFNFLRSDFDIFFLCALGTSN